MRSDRRHAKRAAADASVGGRPQHAALLPRRGARGRRRARADVTAGGDHGGVVETSSARGVAGPDPRATGTRTQQESFDAPAERQLVRLVASSAVGGDSGERLVEDRRQLFHQRVQREDVIDVCGQRWAGREHDVFEMSAVFDR